MDNRRHKAPAPSTKTQGRCLQKGEKNRATSCAATLPAAGRCSRCILLSERDHFRRSNDLVERSKVIHPVTVGFRAAVGGKRSVEFLCGARQYAHDRSGENDKRKS